MEIGPLGPAHEAEAAELLALAFCDQPLDRAVVGGSAARRQRAARAGMRATLSTTRGRADVRGAHRPGEPSRLAGVLLALPPWAHPLPPPSPLVQLRTLLRQGPRVAGRWSEVGEILQAHRPPQPLWYLSLLGVEPELQGRGVGSALLRRWLVDVDAARQPAWLETARTENVRLYERFGFAVREELRLLGIPVWLMARPARAEL
jgi:ribosomal protein S18 acetylase RimI-like enzyme